MEFLNVNDVPALRTLSAPAFNSPWLLLEVQCHQPLMCLEIEYRYTLFNCTSPECASQILPVFPLFNKLKVHGHPVSV